MGATINKILIANRGEIARRIMRTCRADGHRHRGRLSPMPIAMRRLPAKPTKWCRSAALRPAESYLRIDAIIDAARKTAGDAIHPGYGFLSENAEFARACQAAGITFIGPPPEVIAAMGSKIEAKRRMQAAGVPLLPTIEVAEQPAEQVVRADRALGRPLIKASAGGGGRGMRIVRQRRRSSPSCWPTARAGVAVGVWRRHGVRRALRRSGPARRGANLRRHARQRRPPVRARVLDPAAASEDHRRVAPRRPSTTPCAAR